MADTKAAKDAASKASKKKIKKSTGPAKPVKKKAVAAKPPEPSGDASQIGHNSRIPSAKEVEGYFKRLDKLHEEKAEKNASFMSDIKGVYQEAANKFGSSRKIMRLLYSKKRAEEAHAVAVSEMETKEREDLDRITLGASKAFGTDTAFGAWLSAQADVRDLSEEHFDNVEPQSAEIVQQAAAKPKTAAEVAAENIAAEERQIAQERTTH